MLCLIINTAILLSQNFPDIISAESQVIEQKQICSKSEHYKYLFDKSLSNTSRPYDVLKYDIDFDWKDMLERPSQLDSNGHAYLVPDDINWTGNNTITLVVKSDNTNLIEFDAVNLNILSVLVNDVKSTTVPQPISGILNIPLPETHKNGDTIIISINYQFANFIKNQPGGNGFYLYPKHYYINKYPFMTDTTWVEERLAFTMSEPQNARNWMPCNDDPKDKAMSKVTVKVPPDYTAASNGLLNKVEKNIDNWVYFWQSDEPIATYLIAVNASKFHEYADTFARPSNGEKVEIQYYVWDKDFNSTKTDGSEYNPHYAFRYNVQMIDAFTKAYGPYPYKKYGMVALMPFGGGMEHQTLTSFNRDWMRSDFSIGIAHEMSHQWLGDKITCSSWDDIWINEGGAKFSESIWLESQGSKQDFFDKMLLDRHRYLAGGGHDLGRIWGEPVDLIFGSLSLLTYEKGCWVYGMLRSMLGDSTFFSAMKSFLTKYAYQSVSYKDFQKSFEEDVKNPLVPFDVFFRQWMMKPGHPVLKLTKNLIRKLGNLYYEIHFNISQTQSADSVSDIFNVPVKIKYSDNGNNTFEEIRIQNQRSEDYVQTLQFLPSKIEIDTTYILCEVPDGVTEVKEIPSSQNGLNSDVFPNPAINGTQCKLDFNNENENYVKIDIFNELGQFIKTIHNGFLLPDNYEFSFSTYDLLPGVYLIRINTGKEMFVKKFSVVE